MSRIKSFHTYCYIILVIDVWSKTRISRVVYLSIITFSQCIIRRSTSIIREIISTIHLLYPLLLFSIVRYPVAAPISRADAQTQVEVE